MVLAPGIHTDISNHDYHADFAISHSDCCILMEQSAAHWRYQRDNPAEINEQAQKVLDIGTATHVAVLEPQLWSERVRILPYDDYKSRQAREARDECRVLDIVPLLDDAAAEVLAMSRAVHEHEIAGPLLMHGHAEVTYAWKDTRHGIMRKCRPDYVRERSVGMAATDHSAINFKTAISAHPEAIAKAAFRDAWHSSQSYTVEGMAACGVSVADYLYVVVEKDPPHQVVVYRLPERWIEDGSIFNRKAIQRFADAMTFNRWPGYADTIVDLEFPHYAEFQFADRLERGEFKVEKPTKLDISRANDWLKP